MAPVTDRSRAQLVLVTALGLAVALVALSLILNSAIYTENLASRNLDPGTADAVDARGNVRAGLGGLMDRVNDPTAGYATLETNYRRGLGEWNELSSQFGALSGEIVSVSNATDGAGNYIIDRGVRVVDGDAATDFTPLDSSDYDWTVAPDVRARDMRFTVEGGLASADDSTVGGNLDDSYSWDGTGSVFFVDIDNGEWRMAVYRNSGTNDVTIGVYNGSTDTYSTCSITPASTPVRINVGRATINNVPCEALDSVSGQSGPYDIHFANTDMVTGTYELTVDRVIDGTSSEVGAFTDEVDRLNYGNHCSGPTYYGSGGGHPYVAPALYSSQASLDFRSDGVTSDSRVRIAADELSQGASTPRVSQFDVDDVSGTLSGAAFDATWAVADPDGDLSSVTVELLDGGTVVDSVSDSSLSGRTASGTFNLQHSTATLPAQYDLRITVTDAAGNTRTVTQTHQAESDGNEVGCPP